MAKTIRIRDEEESLVEKKIVKIILEQGVRVKDSDIIHTLIDKYLKDLELNDIEQYKEKLAERK
jgi:hypothetical protein